MNRPDFSFPGLLWLWIPLGGMMLQMAMETALPVSVLTPLLSEKGPHEFLQALVLACGLSVALSALIRMSPVRHPGLAAWIGLAAVCQFYVAGEEISWGQHLFGWATPEFWSAINDQSETNLHNTSDWLDQKPRALLMIGVIGGGLLVPPVMARWPEFVPSRFRVLMPTAQFAPVAGIVLMVRLSSLLRDAFEVRLFERASEVSELGMYYFVFLYMILLRDRVRALKEPESTTRRDPLAGP